VTKDVSKDMSSKVSVVPKYWEFNQNNSGGSFEIDPKRGLGPRVWIEAVDRDHAIARALSIGIYFDGVREGMDCPCCGDRWYEPFSDDGRDQPEIDPQYAFNWHDTVYVHQLDGEIISIIDNREKEKG